MTYQINETCIACGACAKKCPEDAIEGEIKVGFEIDPILCMDCGTCFNTCKKGAITDPYGNKSPKKGKGKNNSKARIETQTCAGCKTCFMNCPMEAIEIVKQGFFSNAYCKIDPNLCSGCGTCTENCITGAAELE